MTKLDLANEIVYRTGLTKKKAELSIEVCLGAIKRALARGDRAEFRGFGIFCVRPRKSGTGRNPRSRTEVPIPPGKVVRFKPGKELRHLD